MPILSKEVYVWPEALLSENEPLGDRDDCWWVLHTRPRTEKVIARRLLSDRVPFFLPLYERRHRYRNGSVVSYLPLFPGYVFLRGTNETRLRGLDTSLVARCLNVPQQEQSQLSVDLSRFYELMRTGASMFPEERLLPGTMVEITCGALKNFRGKIVRRSGGLKLIVMLNLLQRAVSVEIDESMIQVVSPNPAELGLAG